MKKTLKLLSLFATSILSVSQAWAQCSVNGKEIPCEEFWSQFGWIFALVGLTFFVFGVFWLWMLVDCLKSNREDKLVWTIVLFLGNIIGAVLYFFIARNKGAKSDG